MLPSPRISLLGLFWGGATLLLHHQHEQHHGAARAFVPSTAVARHPASASSSAIIQNNAWLFRKQQRRDSISGGGCSLGRRTRPSRRQMRLQMSDLTTQPHQDDEWHPHDPAWSTPQLLKGIWSQIAQAKDMVRGVSSDSSDGGRVRV